ncbi:MAG: hypothetical protein SGJ05_06760 [bacterium]|nr:hypothetical protein [bacterium]
MKPFLLLVLTFCISTSALAQTLIRAKDIGERGLGSRIFATGTGSWIMLNNPGFGTTEYLNLDRVGYVHQATSSDDLVVGAINGGLAVIQGTSVRTFALVDSLTNTDGSVYPFRADVYGVDFINRDTLLCNTQSSIFVIPRALLTATSGVQTEPGIIIAGTRNQLANIVDGLAEVAWSLYDNTGRSLHSGTLAMGERTHRLPLEGVSSGVYHLILNAQGKEARSVELLVTH